MSESDLYLRIKELVETEFGKVGVCRLEITASKIEEDVKRILGSDAVAILETEKMRPDVLGVVGTRNQLLIDRVCLVIIEVKNGPLKFEDIYQLKKYSETFSASFAFLISTEMFSEARRRFLAMNAHIMEYQIRKRFSQKETRRIFAFSLRNDMLTQDTMLNSEDPFDAAGLWLA